MRATHSVSVGSAQGGYVGLLLLTLISLLLVGVVRQATLANHTKTWHELIDARRALLAYAVTYPLLYGPAGAGPGHLPCPDTDVPVWWGGQENDSPFSGAGPNPPCGRGVVAMGLLPRHVRIGHQRHAFHPLPTQSIGYAVSTNFVNNPRRTVNTFTRGQFSLDDQPDIVAVLIAGPADQLPRLRNRGGLSTTLVPNQLESSDEFDVANVASWWRPNNDRQHYVTISSHDIRKSVEAYVIDWSLRQLNALHCIELVNEQCNRASFDSLIPTTDGYYLLDVMAQYAKTGASVELNFNLEGIDPESHWFTTNDWSSIVFVDVDPACDDMNQLCQWQHIANDLPSNTIKLHLTPQVPNNGISS